jgi:hypothetical protein
LLQILFGEFEKMRRFLCLVLTGALLIGAVPLYAPVASGIFSPPPEADGDIDYQSVKEVAVRGYIATLSGLPSPSDCFIDLQKETVFMPATYTALSYSIDGGVRWKAVNNRTFSPKKFPALLNNDLRLHLSNNPLDRKTKLPAEEAEERIVFADIRKRPKPPALAVNYRIDPDLPTTPPALATDGSIIDPGRGRWVLAAKGDADSVYPGIQIAAMAGRKIDRNGFGEFHKHSSPSSLAGEVKGIEVKPSEIVRGKAKVRRTEYFWRLAPREITDPATGAVTAYEAASKPKKIKATSEVKSPHKYEIKADRSGNVLVTCIHCKAPYVKEGTFIIINGEHNEAGTISSISRSRELGENTPVRVLARGENGIDQFKGEIMIWRPARHNRAVSVKQVLSYPLPPP